MAGWFGRSQKSSSSSSRPRGWLNPFTLMLAVTSIGLFASTAALYWQHERSREALSVSVRTPGWVAYQAQLELVKSLAAIRVAAVNPTMEELDNVILRLAILRSRLPLLYASDRGRLLPNIEAYQKVLQQYEASIDRYLDMAAPTAGSAEARRILNDLHAEIEALVPTLQTVLQSAIDYNEEISRREQLLAESPAILPLGLLFLSGTLLIVLLFLQTGRDRRRLRLTEQAEAEAASARENLRAVIESTPAMIVVFDPVDLSISFGNTAAFTLINASAEHPDWKRFLVAMRTALTGPQSLKGMGSFSFQREDGSILALRGSCRPVVWEGRNQAMTALADTTQLRDAEYQILQAAKLSTLGEMASAIAHEINQPLAVIRMAAANAQRLLANGEQAALQAKLARIDEQVERAKRIIDQVRRYGRKPSLRSERFVLPRAIDLAIGFVAEQYRMTGIRLVLDIDLPDDLVVEGEQTLFEQVIVNMLLNARDAFESEDIGADRRKVTIRAVSDGIKIRISLTDAAGGISTDILGDVFEPFTTTKPDDKGTGLGLSLSRNIVRKMNGEISVENVEEGARFLIVLPVPVAAADERSVA